jgi:hypothetical protein
MTESLSKRKGIPDLTRARCGLDSVFTLESFMDKGPCHIDTPFDKEQDIAVTTPDFTVTNAAATPSVL